MIEGDRTVMEQMAEPPPAPMHYLSPKLAARPAPNKGGMGVYACEPIRRGEVVAMWGGRVIPVEEIYYYNEELRRYLIQVEEGLFLTPSWPTEPAEYFNHSCDPNTGLSGQSALVAMRDIEAGEEVCFDYAMSESHPLFEFECHCGTALCRGQTSAEDWRNRELQIRYAGYFSPYLQRRIEALRRIEPIAPAPELEVVSAVRSNVRRVSGWRGGRARSR
jgi:uncharacterized protein